METEGEKKKKKKGKVCRYCRMGRGCLQHQSNGLLLRQQAALGHNESLPSEILWLLVGYGGSGALMKAVLLRCHFTQLLCEKLFFRKVKRKKKKWCFFLLPTSKTCLMLELTVAHPPTSSFIPTCMEYKKNKIKKHHHSDHIKARRLSVHPVRLQHRNSRFGSILRCNWIHICCSDCTNNLLHMDTNTDINTN